MAGLYDDAADFLGVRGKPTANTGFSASDAVNFLTSADAAPAREPSKLPPDSVEPTPANPSPEPPKSLLRRLVDSHIGGVEAAGSIASGIVAAPIAAAAGLYRGLTGGKYGTQEGTKEAQARASEVLSYLTYQPRSDTGQEAVGAVSRVIDDSKIGGMGPTEGMALAGVMAGPKVAARTQPAGMPQRASVGAAAASNTAQIQELATRASPEVQAMIQKAGPAKVNPVTLERHVDAESLPVPIQLTRGQATQDPGIISAEQNLRGKHEQFRNRFNDQNTKLIENANAIREAAAPDVYATTNPQIGQLVIDAYTAKDVAANAKITSAYKALRDANGGALPIDGIAFVDAADAALHKKLLFDHVPPALRKTMDRLRDGQAMTFENFESMRTNLARIQRSAADGNEKAAAGVIRNALEELPMPQGAEHLKPLADAARQLAKERFAAIEADKAYKAVISGKASADKFVEKYVIGGDLKSVETMKANLGHDQTAQQALAAGTMNYLKRNSGIVDNAGNFSQAGYNKALESVRPKLGVIFEPEQRNQVEALGRVARFTQAQPRGAFVNNSNTFTSAVAEHGKGAAEGFANVAAGGVPVGTWGRKIGGRYLEQRELNKALQPGAGILLKDVAR